jgi:VanZ family protein
VNPLAPLWLRILAWLAVAAWVAIIHYFSSLTGPEIAQVGFTVWDKAAHFIAFAAGGVALALALRWSVNWPSKKVAWCGIGVLAFYGALDEIHQLSTPNRTGADPLDWLADGLGAATGVMLCLVIYARFFRAHSAAPARA